MLSWAIRQFKSLAQTNSAIAPLYLRVVVREGNLDTLKSLNVDKSQLSAILWEAIKRNHVHILNWTRESQLLTPNKSTYSGILDWELETDAPPPTVHHVTRDVGYCETAASDGHLEALQWLRANGFEWDWRTCREAVFNGHIEILKWAVNNGCPKNEPCCSAAAHTGNLECLKWLRNNGCPWNSLVCAYAAESGHLNVLQWAIENKCPYDKNIFEKAFNRGHIHIYEWGKKHNYVK